MRDPRAGSYLLGREGAAAPGHRGEPGDLTGAEFPKLLERSRASAYGSAERGPGPAREKEPAAGGGADQAGGGAEQPGQGGREGVGGGARRRG